MKANILIAAIIAAFSLAMAVDTYAEESTLEKFDMIKVNRK